MDMDFAKARQRMVDGQIRPVNVTDLAVIAAFLNTPREIFVPRERQGRAYADGRLELAPAGDGRPPRYMPPAAALARLIQLANIGPADFVLDVGAATGYGAAIMAQLGSAVVALECDAGLLKHGETLFAAHKCENITMIEGPLARGCTSQAPYDVIILEGAVEAVPEALLAQLREGGRLAAVEGRGAAAFACLYEREDGMISRRRAFNLALDPLPGMAAGPGFTF